jgi:hypothetical protein
MNKYLSVFCILFGYGIFGGHSFAKAQTASSHIDFTFAPGLSFGHVNWNFMDDRTDNKYHVNSLLAFSAGMQYGPVLKIDGAVLYSSLEMGFGTLKTKSCEIVPISYPRRDEKEYYANLEIQRIPVMFWMTITTEMKLSPFVRFGAGISNTGFKEVYSYQDGPTVQFHKWAFTWGIGGGVRLTTSDESELALFLDDWITNAELVGKSSTNLRQNGPGTPFKMTVVGIRVVMHLKSY